MSARTPNQIISDALKLLGNETVVDEAEIWLNNALDDLYNNDRWPFQEKSATGSIVAGQTSIDLPADFGDFWDRNGLRVQDANGNRRRVVVLDSDSFDLMFQPNIQGMPLYARLNFNTLSWEPFPTPDVPYTWRLRYKYLPARISDFDADPIIFPDDNLLTQAVFVKGLQFEDDDRYPAEMAVLEKMIKTSRRGYNISPTKGTTVKFQNQTFKGIGSFR